jgi:hypothetical protein
MGGDLEHAKHAHPPPKKKQCLVGQAVLSKPRNIIGKKYQSLSFLSSSHQHNRFVLDCKDKEPDVLFVGDSMVQLMQQYEVKGEERVRVVLATRVCPLITKERSF